MAYLRGTPNDKHTTKYSVWNKMFGNQKPTTNDTEPSKEKLSEQFRFKLSKQTRSKLQLLSKATGKSQGAIIREGITALSKSASGAKELYVGNRLYRIVKSVNAKKIG